jgi:hypothetical protein
LVSEALLGFKTEEIVEVVAHKHLFMGSRAEHLADEQIQAFVERSRGRFLGNPVETPCCFWKARLNCYFHDLYQPGASKRLG